MNNYILKILAVSLMGNQKNKAYAVYNGEQLIITAVMTITGLFSSWRKPLIAEIEEKTAAGYVVLVEEMTDMISQHATKYLLEAVEGRSNLYDALDWYFALQDMGNLVVDEEVKRYVIRSGSEGQRIEKKQDDKGRTYYNIDWSAFHGGYRAVLLCVIAALQEPVNRRYLREMYGPERADREDTNPARRMRELLHQEDIRRGQAIEQSRVSTGYYRDSSREAWLEWAAGRKGRGKAG